MAINSQKKIKNSSSKTKNTISKGIKKLETKYKIFDKDYEIYALKNEENGAITITPKDMQNCFYFIRSNPELVGRIAKLILKATQL